jgi:sulfur carrier protein
MKVHVNGESKDLPDGATVARLIQSLALGGARVAVEVNKELVVRKAWDAHVLKDGDRVEVVTFVGGG